MIPLFFFEGPCLRSLLYWQEACQSYKLLTIIRLGEVVRMIWRPLNTISGSNRRFGKQIGIYCRSVPTEKPRFAKHGSRPFQFRPKTQVEISVSTPFWVEFVCVEGRTAEARECSDASPAASAEQCSEQCSAAGTDRHIYDVAMTSVKTRTPVRRVACGRITGRVVTSCGACVAARGVGTRNMPVAAAAWMSLDRKRQADCHNQEHHHGNQKLSHRAYLPLLNFNSEREIC